MKNKIVSILLVLSSFVCAESIIDKNNKLTTLTYISYIEQNEKNVLSETKYFNKWINIPVNTQLTSSRVINAETLIEVKEFFRTSDLVAIVKNQRFKIHSYTKDDNEKVIEYEAKVVKCFKGECPPTISYFVSYEIDDSIYPDGSQNETLFLEMIDKKYYADVFLMLSANKSIEQVLERAGKE